MNRWFCLMVVIVLAAVDARPDVVHFKNGDQLTGKLERVQGAKVVLKTETIGEVEIPTDKIASYSSEGETVALVKDQKEVRGAAALLPSGDWKVETPSGPQVVQAKSVQIIYPAKTYDEKGYGHKPKLWQSWGGKGSLGFSQVRGDQTSRTFSLNFSATRRLPVLPELAERSRTNFFLNTLFAKSQDTQGNQVSTNNISSGIRQDFKFTKKNFWFLLAQLDHSSTQSLDLRQTYGAGLGRDLLRRSNMELQAFGGVTYVREHFQGEVFNRNAEALAGERLSWKLTDWLSLDHNLSFYPNLTDSGAYRFDTMTGLSTKITKRWSFSTSYSDHYLSNPLPGHRKNEVIITTGVGVTF